MNDSSHKRGRGRPKLSDTDERRDKRLPVIQVSESELNTYKEAAEREKMTFSGWVREVLHKASK